MNRPTTSVICLTAGLVLIAVGCQPQPNIKTQETQRSHTPVNTSDISAQQAHELLNDDHQAYRYLDVRTEAEFERGHVPGAINVPVLFFTAEGPELNDAFLDTVRRDLPADAPIICGCKSGRRSAKAVDILRQAGYSNVVNMMGGFEGAYDTDGQLVEPGWKSLGFEVETKTPGNP